MNRLKYFVNYFCALLLLSSPYLFAQPVNPDGGFEEGTPGPVAGTDVPGWSFIIGGTGEANFEVVTDEYYEGSKSLRVEVTNLGTNAWDIQIVNEPFTVEPATTYTYDIWVRSEVEGVIANFTVGNPSYAEFGRMGGVTISTDWQEVKFDFDTPTDASEARAPIHLGEAANAPLIPFQLYFDDLKIYNAATGVNDNSTTPRKFALEQNYPNPFNPSTTIQFSVPVQSDVRINLYDVVGNFIKEITNKNYQPGNYRVQFDGSNLSTGVYFYKIQAGNFMDVKKLMLMK